MNRRNQPDRRQADRYDPNATQALAERASRSDRHAINELQWEAIRNQDDGIKDMFDKHASLSERLVKIETTLRNLQWLVGVGLAVLGILIGTHK